MYYLLKILPSAEEDVYTLATQTTIATSDFLLPSFTNSTLDIEFRPFIVRTYPQKDTVEREKLENNFFYLASHSEPYGKAVLQAPSLKELKQRIRTEHPELLL